jgi:hypothetical protein
MKQMNYVSFENVSKEMIKIMQKEETIVFRDNTIELFTKHNGPSHVFTGTARNNVLILTSIMFINNFDSTFFTLSNLLKAGDTLSFAFWKGYHNNQYMEHANLESETIIAEIQRGKKRFFFEIKNSIIPINHFTNTMFRR